MNSYFSIKNHTVHLWHSILPDWFEREAELLALLSPDEVNRAQRFRFAIHRQRFIAARGMLRQIISLYTQIPPADILFSYGARGKPYLRDSTLQFNLSHSEDLAVYAITLEHPIGVDIEKIETPCKHDVAQRFFSEQEYHELSLLPQSEQAIAFYRIWSKKEALIKALGEGLFAPLESFSVSSQSTDEWVSITHEEEVKRYYLQNFFVHPEYEAAFATYQTVDRVSHWQWLAEGPKEMERWGR